MFLNALGRLPSVFLCLEARKDRNNGAQLSSLAVALAISARSFLGVSAGGGVGCQFHRGVSLNLFFPWDKRYTVWHGGVSRWGCWGLLGR